MTWLPTLNQLFALFTIGGQLLILVTLLTLLLPSRRQNRWLTFLSNRAILLSFLISLAATATSLIYSDAVGFEPCVLCWYQRIFMYSQTIILAMALWERETARAAVNFVFVFSGMGALIAGYQYLIQMGVAGSNACALGESSANCSQRLVFEFGYITIPLMAFTSFVFIILLLGIRKWYTKG